MPLCGGSRTHKKLTKEGSSVECVGGRFAENQPEQWFSGIWSGTQKRAENSTVSQASQGTGFASPAAALTALRHSACR